MSKKTTINQAEYGEILQQAVAEILVARNVVTRQLASATNPCIGVWESYFLKNSWLRVMAVGLQNNFLWI